MKTTTLQKTKTMKTITKSKTILAALIAIITAGSVSAETIYITGATAFRGAANNVIDAYAIASQGGATNLARVAFDTNKITSALYGVWKLGNGDYISAHWVGSQAGIQSVTGPSSVITTNKNVISTNWATSSVNPGGYTRVSGTGTSTIWKQLQTNQVTVTLQTPNTVPFWVPELISAPAGSVPVATNGTAATTNTTAVLGFVDTFQSSSPFAAGHSVAYYSTNGYQSNGLISSNLPALSTNVYTAASADYLIAAVGFSFFTTPGSPVFNITQAQAKKLITKGSINAYELTLQLSDTNAGIYLAGRNIDAGARANLLSWAGLGSALTSVGVNKGVSQYAILQPGASLNYSDGSLYTNNPANASTALVAPWPAEVIDGKLSAPGAGGYSSGSALATAITTATNLPSGVSSNLPGKSYVIGYSGAAEAKSAGAQFVNVNNVPFNVETIKSGAYPYWSFMHILVAPNAGTNASSIASTLATTTTQLSTATLGGYSYGTVSLSDLTNKVSRQFGVDGGTVTLLWTNSTAFTNLPAW
jgi:hypothetical protein